MAGLGATRGRRLVKERIDPGSCYLYPGVAWLFRGLASAWALLRGPAPAILFIECLFVWNLWAADSGAAFEFAEASERSNLG